MNGAAIDVQLAADCAGLPDADALAGYARAAIIAKAANAQLTLRVVDVHEGAALNAQYRGREGPTNVLSFPFELPPGLPAGELNVLGDVVLCAPVARDEARAQHKTLAAHIAHLAVHGVLHLQGFDHEREADAIRMEQREREILAALGFADPYAGEHRSS